MPELPEAETVRRQLEGQVVGARIKLAWARIPRITKPSVEQFARLLQGTQITAALRRGKQLYFPLDNGSNLMIHLGMTGKLYVEKAKAPFNSELVPKYVHGVILFEDGRQLVFEDPRQFGALAVSTELPFLAQMGPEPLDTDFDEDALARKLRTRTVKIKSALLDQSLVAGLGSIYADDVCFLAGVHPEQRACDISLARMKVLVSHMRPVLERAIAARGATLKDGGYQDTFGQYGEYLPHVYGRAGEQCARCGTPIRRGVLGPAKGARSHHFCPKCQPLRRKRAVKA